MSKSLLERLKNSIDSIKEIAIVYIAAATIVAVLFALFEGKDIFISYWWTFVTGLTIGYGDIYPITTAGRMLAIIWGHFMVFLFAPVAVGHVVINMIKNKDEWTDKEQKEMMRLLRKLAKEKGNE